MIYTIGLLKIVIANVASNLCRIIVIVRRMFEDVYLYYVEK